MAKRSSSKSATQGQLPGVHRSVPRQNLSNPFRTVPQIVDSDLVVHEIHRHGVILDATRYDLITKCHRAFNWGGGSNTDLYTDEQLCDPAPRDARTTCLSCLGRIERPLPSHHDKLRGLSADRVFIDEAQDMLPNKEP